MRKEAVNNPMTLNEIIEVISYGDISIETGRTAIMELVKACVPARVADSYEEGQWEPEFYQGFNACRQQMLENLEKL